MNILIVDHEKEWQEVAKPICLKMRQHLIISQSANTAIKMASANAIHTCIIRTNIEETDALLLLIKELKMHHLQCEIFLKLPTIKNEETYFITEDIFKKIGVQNIFYKNDTLDLSEILLTVSHLQEKIAKITDQRKNNQKKLNGMDPEIDLDYIKIPIDEFFPSRNVLFDTYVNISSHKFVKILHAGHRFDHEQFNRYIEKEVDYFFIKRDDRIKYIHYCISLSQQYLDTLNSCIHENAPIIKGMTEKIIEEIYDSGVRPELIRSGEKVVKNMYKMISNNNETKSFVDSLQALGADSYNHSYLVSLFSIMMVKQFNWVNDMTIENIGLAALLHDIGSTALPEEMLTMKTKDMSPTQLKLYKRHPLLGAEMIHKSKQIGISVAQIISQHHEAFNGSGFPRGLSGKRIMPLASIVFLADNFVEYMTETKQIAIIALETFAQDPEEKSKFCPQTFEKFLDIFKEEEEEDL